VISKDVIEVMDFASSSSGAVGDLKGRLRLESRFSLALAAAASDRLVVAVRPITDDQHFDPTPDLLSLNLSVNPIYPAGWWSLDAIKVASVCLIRPEC
jgi:hypothetical protein